LNDDGVLTLAEASTTGYRQLAQAKVLPGPDAWGPMALTDGRLVLRDLNRMACLDVAAK
jgi:outer membrane protein assembly factor BamB